MEDFRAGDPPNGGAPHGAGAGLRRQVAKMLVDRADVIADDTLLLVPRLLAETDPQVGRRLGAALIGVVAETVGAGSCDARGRGIAAIATLVSEGALPTERFFDFAYLVQGTMLDEVALDDRLGATSDHWPHVTDAIRRAVFSVLAAWACGMLETPDERSIIDRLTTLHTRPVLEAALLKECQRAERFEHWLALILLDVDNVSELNRVYGYGVGDRILERLGILLRSYFRIHDWVARYGGDSVAVLLPETAPEDALRLAERTRVMVQERLTFRDHRTDQRVEVTVSTAVVSARAVQGTPIDAVRVLAEAEALVAKAKSGGRNRVEHVRIIPPARPRTDP